MIQMFPEPISAVHRDKGPVMLLGILGEAGPMSALAVDGDGDVIEVATAELSIDWRYDWRTGRWVDVGPYEGDDGDDEEAADGGGEAVPGDVPGVDGAD